MPRFLENKLKAEYGANSATPYKVMNALGVMHGNKETAKGRAMEAKHDAKALHPKMAAHGAKVAAAHKFLSVKVPGFKLMPAKQRMQTVQAHVRRMK